MIGSPQTIAARASMQKSMPHRELPLPSIQPHGAKIDKACFTAGSRKTSAWLHAQRQGRFALRLVAGGEHLVTFGVGFQFVGPEPGRFKRAFDIKRHLIGKVGRSRIIGNTVRQATYGMHST